MHVFCSSNFVRWIKFHSYNANFKLRVLSSKEYFEAGTKEGAAGASRFFNDFGSGQIISDEIIIASPKFIKEHTLAAGIEHNHLLNHRRGQHIN